MADKWNSVGQKSGDKPGLPTVSVVIAAYNASAWLKHSVDSALSQEGVEVDVLIADDQSTDDTFDVAKKLAERDPRVTAIRCAENGGPGAARNTALNVSKGQWVAVLDSDDRYAPDRLAMLCDEAEKQAVDIILDDFIAQDENGVPLDERSLSDIWGPGAMTLADWIGLNRVAHGEVSFGYAKPVIKRDFIEAHSLRYDESLRNGEDFHLVLAAMISGARVWFSATPGYYYTRRMGSVSRRAQDDHLRALLVADRAAEVRLNAMGESEVLAFMRERRRNLESLMTSERVFGAIKAANAATVFSELMRNPRATPRIFSHAREAVTKRLPRWL
ncbi:glycosyltransferase family 2 protein [Heliomarina baculiformis]|uniref:glycosyltransferase family 2 protein n=1 Tax=Heliomarina baculiformis TaxID=2872036 RepID=UPI001EE36FA7